MTDRNYVGAPLESVPNDVKLPYPIYVWVDKRMILFRKKGDTLESIRADKLQAKVDTVYITAEDWEQFLLDLEEKNDCGFIEPMEAIRNIRNLLYAYQKDLEHKREINKKTFDKMHSLSKNLTRAVLEAPTTAVRFLNRYSDPSLYLSNHSVNTGTFCALMAVKLKWSQSKILSLTSAALLHNIGLTKISSSILQKPGKLTPEEWSQIHMHPQIGAEILMHLGAPADVVRATREHHEQPNGNGYPKGLKKNEISDLASMIAIADVYDALLSNRYWSNALSAENALKAMGEMSGRFDESLFSSGLVVR